MPLDAGFDRTSVGGKAAGLAGAIRLGHSVPAGVVVPIDLIRSENRGAGDLGVRLRAATASLQPPFAVRSSGVDEDSAQASHAGQYLTMLSVASEDVYSAVRECAADGVAVIVQEMVGATVAGVAFSVDPVTGRTGVVVEAVGGLADHLLEGTVDGEHWVDGADQAGHTVLTDAQASEVVALVEALSQAIGSPVDVEWAFDDRQLWLLQVRPLSVFARRPTIDLPDRQTWTQEPRFPEPMHRLSFSNWFPIHTAALRQVFTEFGLPVETVEHRRVEGRVYSREVPFGGGTKDGMRLPAWMMALAFRLPPLRSRLANAKRYDGDQAVVALMVEWESTTGPAAVTETRQLRQADLARLDGSELSDHIDRVRRHIRELAVIHFRLTLGAVMIPTGRLGLFVQEHLGWDPSQVIDLVTGFGDGSLEAGRMLSELAARLTGEQQAAIQADRTAVFGIDGIDELLDRHGHRVNIDLTKPTLAEDFGRLVHLLLAAGADSGNPQARAEERQTEALAALDPSLDGEFRSLLQLARRGRPHQDASELAVLDAVTLMRPIALEAGRRWRQLDSFPWRRTSGTSTSMSCSRCSLMRTHRCPISWSGAPKSPGRRHTTLCAASDRIRHLCRA
jgi:pyruvate,water dikinase